MQLLGKANVTHAASRAPPVRDATAGLPKRGQLPGLRSSRTEALAKLAQVLAEADAA